MVTLLTTQLVIILKNQVVIDTIVNSFGVSFIGLLKDVGMCIVNGRGKPELETILPLFHLGVRQLLTTVLLLILTWIM